MFCQSYSAIQSGKQSQQIRIEAEEIFGVPGLQILGGKGSIVQEAKVRVTAALMTAGVRLKARKIVINLSPVTLAKNDSSLDFALAVTLLQIQGRGKIPQRSIFIGELSLEGELRSCPAIVAFVLAARDWGFREVFLPAVDSARLLSLEGIKIHPIHSLQEFIFIQEGKALMPVLENRKKSGSREDGHLRIFPDSVFLEKLIILSFAAKHHCFFLGSKDELLLSFLENMQKDICLRLSAEELWQLVRQFHFFSKEKNFDDFSPPFNLIKESNFSSRQTLEQDLLLAETGSVFLENLLSHPAAFNQLLTVLRMSETGKVPRVSLFASAALCPCGDARRQNDCQCRHAERNRYQRLFQHSLIGEFDIFFPINENTWQVYQNDETQKAIFKEKEKFYKRKLFLMKQFQEERYASIPAWRRYNALLTDREIKAFIRLGEKEELFFSQLIEKFQIRDSQKRRLLSLARSIADFAERKDILRKDLTEAFQLFRANPQLKRVTERT